MINLFCKHDYKIIIKTQTPTFTRLPGCSEHMAERMLFGMTTILWECKKCKKIKKEEMLGYEIKGE